MKKSLLIFFITFILSAMPVFAGEVDRGEVSGKLLIKGGAPMAGGIVAFFNERSGPPPAQDKYWRVPDEIADIDEDGKIIDEYGNFSLKLLEGKYYMWAIKRISGENVGPPREGDYFYSLRDEEGKQKSIVVIEGEYVDLGIIAGALPFKSIIAEKITAIEGVILDMDKKPVGGAIVFAYTAATISAQPLFVSDITDDAGKYILRVHEGGKYYLRVRDVYGGGPFDGGPLMSGYSVTAVNVKTREIKKGTDITVIRRLERGPEGRKESIQ